MATKDKKTIFVSGVADDLLIVEDVSKLDHRRKITKKKGFSKTSDSIRGASAVLNKKRSQNFLKSATGRGFKLDNKFLKALAFAERFLRGDLSVLLRLLPEQYRSLFMQIDKVLSISDRLFNTKSGPRRYTPKKVAKRQKADKTAIAVKNHSKSYDLDKAKGNASLRDYAVESKLYGDVIKDYASLDDPAEIMDLINSISDPILKRMVTIIAIHELAKNGNISNLSDLIDSVGVAAVIAKHPDIVITIIQNFKIKNEYLSMSHEALGKLIVDLLNKINPLWHLTLRGNVLVSNLRVYQYLSVDSKLVLMAYKLPKPADRTNNEWVELDYGNVHIPAIVICKAILYEDMESIVKKDYPRIPFSFS